MVMVMMPPVSQIKVDARFSPVVEAMVVVPPMVAIPVSTTVHLRHFSSLTRHHDP